MELIRAGQDRFDTIVALFRRYAFALQDRGQFEWKHLQGPMASPHVFEVRLEGRTVGTGAFVPQPFRLGDRKLVGFQAVDCLMGEEIRGKRLFPEVLRMMTDAPRDDAHLPLFFIAFPSLPASVKGFTAAGWRVVDRIRVYKAVLRAEALRNLPGSAITTPLAGMFLPLLRQRLFRGAGTVRVERVERFSEDLDRFQPDDRVCGGRSAAFLNWRIIDNPRGDHRGYLFFAGETTIGYALVTRRTETWHVMEFRVKEDGRACTAALLRHLYAEEGAASVEFWQPEGFLQREALPLGVIDRGPVAFVFVHGAGDIGLPLEPERWAAGYVDSDW